MQAAPLNDFLDILYRGPLASCNYDCGYCPFAKTQHTREMLRRDTVALTRFAQWVLGNRSRTLSILLTPWGEAMHLRHYQRALVAISRARHVERVGIQTNGTGPTRFLERACLESLSLWVTYHPSEISRGTFLARCEEFRARGVRHSVGLVGRPDYLDEAEAMRAALPDSTYVWVNAYRDPKNSAAPAASFYSDDEIVRFTAVDPWFELNLRGLQRSGHRSLGAPCRAGFNSISVDGEGDVRRCHFVGDVIGNLYSGDAARAFLSPAPSPCPNQVCDCHIGYTQRPEITEALSPTFGRHGLLRVPSLAKSAER
ncbi:MAG: STM4011 family radical SAM protein [Planctomycetota bacterium]